MWYPSLRGTARKWSALPAETLRKEPAFDAAPPKTSMGLGHGAGLGVDKAECISCIDGWPCAVFTKDTTAVPLEPSSMALNP
ncbi:hypothetical protein TCAP_06838 [Tolypocladium capitatum]|uniref:Uncharacterized protein n=1 Tax=Tolypocladium capitatum TaxID=45235 RepID=A0A2K3Q6M8_9HYPO|nr:hypothetical protein TCAP_06838 [Tolypocladium capitatum]